MNNKLICPSQFLQEGIKVAVIGAGGTGSAMCAGLVSMCTAFKSLGGIDIKVTLFDDDIVSPANIARQAFAPNDIGEFKSSIIAQRANMTFGLDWRAEQRRFRSQDYEFDLFIGCVDTRKARSIINAAFQQRATYGETWWLDCGNTASTGQVILGAKSGRTVLTPSAADLFPEMINPELDADDTGPSCSLPEALRKQDLFINRRVALEASELLWQLFRKGETSFHGAFVNSESMRGAPLRVDPAAWKRMGFELPKVPKPKPATKTRRKNVPAPVAT